MKPEIILALLILVSVNLYGQDLLNTPNAVYAPETWEISAPAQITKAADSFSAVSISARNMADFPDELCGGLLYAGVDMWSGYSVFTIKNGLESALKKDELAQLLLLDGKSRKYYEDAEFKKIFSVSFSILAAASAAILIIESGFFESGLIAGGRPAVLAASGAAVPVFIFASNWAANEAFNDINRSVNVYNTNISCGNKK